jgi:hypothetical protein
MNIAPNGNTMDGLANAAITAGQALKMVESAPDVQFTPCTADTDMLIGFALNDASAGEAVLVQIDGPVRFLAGGTFDATTDLGKRLTCGAAGKMVLAGAAKIHWLQWAPRGASIKAPTTADVADGDLTYGKFCTGTTAA